MTAWEQKIINSFVSRYLASPQKAGAADTSGQRIVRLRSVSIFPEFDTAAPDEKESYLEAAEALERKGFISLSWEKRGKGERIKTLICPDCEKLLKETGKRIPRVDAENIRTMIKKSLPRMEVIAAGVNGKSGSVSEADKIISFLNFLAEDFSPADIKRGMDPAAPEDLVRLMETALEPAKWKQMSTRALSIELYNDSKRLEYLLALASPFLSRAQKEGVPVPDISFLERSFPDTMISGKLIFETTQRKQLSKPPLVNAEGLILGLPLSSVLKIRKIKTIVPQKRPTALTIENKETFYALADCGGVAGYDCYLYTNGYPGRAVAAIIRVLAASGFCFFHAGDLDPDGICILQTVGDIAEKPVTPLRMDAATFDRYLSWARPVDKNMGQLLQINKSVRAIPELTGLIHRIEETRRGVEQEIIDYR
jgi:RNase P subunit RPR2